MLFDKRGIWSRPNEKSKWINDFEEDEEVPPYDGNPHYHRLIETILDLAPELELYEKEDAYLLINKDQKVDLFKAFQPLYDLSVSGIHPDDLRTDVIIRINKENFYLEDVSSYFDYLAGQNYLLIFVNTNHEKWNDLNKDHFKLKSADSPNELID